MDDRKKYLGGSDAAGVLGLSRWKTPLSIWAEKTGQYIPPDEPALHKTLGKRLEEVVTEMFTEHTGKTVRRVNETLFHKTHPFLGANIDRRVLNEDAILECKTASAYKAKEWDGEEIPQEYIIQCVHYLAVTGTKKAYLAVLIGNQDFKVKEIERDPVMISQLIQKEAHFWNEFVVPQKMPGIITRNDAATLFGLYPAHEPGSVIQLDDEANKLIEARSAYLRDLDNIKGLLEKTDNEIKALLKDKETGLTQNWKVTWKSQTRKAYAVAESTFRALRVTELKEAAIHGNGK